MDTLDIEAAAMRLLGLREHSRYQLRKKLLDRFDDEELIAYALDVLEGHGYLSDERFTESWVGVRTRKGYGPLKIRAELDERGISSELIDAWVDIGGQEWRDQLSSVAAQKFGGDKAHDRKEQMRRARFLKYRGFPESLIRQYLWD